MIEPTRTTSATLERAERERIPAEFPQEFLAFLAELRGRFEPRRAAIQAGRERSLTATHAGRPPGCRAESEATRGEWRIELSEWPGERRNGITGSADNPGFGITMPNHRLTLENITKECSR